MPVVNAIDLLIDIRANTLQISFTLPADPGLAELGHGTLDIGANGRLLGIELDSVYVSVMDMEPGRDDLVRSAKIPVTVSSSESPQVTAVTFRRAGDDYEITYPSGNQCWTRHNVIGPDGKPVHTCAVLVASANP